MKDSPPARTMPEDPTDPGLPRVGQGKVRDLYEVDRERLLIVASDRISAFDVVFRETLPEKGCILTALSRFWFARMESLIPNHELKEDWSALVRSQALPYLRGRSMLVRRLQPLPLEAVVRGYLAGSAWQAYRKGDPLPGIPLPAGLREADPLPEVLYTPTSKSPAGEHDRPISFDETVSRIGNGALATEVRERSIAIFREASRYAETRGLIIADAKFEFGLDATGNLFLIDELLTPDSTRYWPRDEYRPGSSPPSFDKQFLRQWLETLGWDKKPPPPSLPAHILAATRERYVEACSRLMGEVGY